MFTQIEDTNTKIYSGLTQNIYCMSILRAGFSFIRHEWSANNYHILPTVLKGIIATG